MERTLDYYEIIGWLESLPLKRFDLVVGVARGGLVLAALVSQITGIEMDSVWIHLRDEDKKELYRKPKLLRKMDFDPKGKRILLVDDMSKSGKTLSLAKNLLKDAKEIKTLVISGKADYSLIPSGGCIEVPWTVKSCSGR